MILQSTPYPCRPSESAPHVADGIDEVTYGRRPIALVRQLRVGIGRRDMGVVGPSLPTKCDGRVAQIWRRLSALIEQADPPLVLVWFQQHFHRHNTLERGIGLRQGDIQRRMRGDQFLIDRESLGLIKESFEESALRKAPLPVLRKRRVIPRRRVQVQTDKPPEHQVPG